jgi:hypothetical protein
MAMLFIPAALSIPLWGLKFNFYSDATFVGIKGQFTFLVLLQLAINFL